MGWNCLGVRAVSCKINYYVIQLLPHRKSSLFPLDLLTPKSYLIQLIFVYKISFYKRH